MLSVSINFRNMKNVRIGIWQSNPKDYKNLFFVKDDFSESENLCLKLTHSPYSIVYVDLWLKNWKLHLYSA